MGVCPSRIRERVGEAMRRNNTEREQSLGPVGYVIVMGFSGLIVLGLSVMGYLVYSVVAWFVKGFWL